MKGIIKSDLKNGVRNRVIGLYNTPEVCYERVLKRARQGETAAYSIESIRQNCHAYDKLYSLIEDKKSKVIRAFDLGELYRE